LGFILIKIEFHAHPLSVGFPAKKGRSYSIRGLISIAPSYTTLNNERIKIVPPLLAIADDINAGLFLQGHGLLHRLDRHTIKLGGTQASSLFATQCVQERL
jgi:hypothetical protein